MDLYRFANKIAPWCSSELLGDAFLLAADARQVDMRASPYDLRDQGFEPIPIENSSGREEYIQEQRRLAELAAPIRERLVEVYTALVAAYR
jgi:propanediol dehydratase small subunit